MPDHVVIVGASLAGVRAAEQLRSAGFDGPVTMVGEEPHPPYDRPPLSKQVLTGKVAAGDTTLDIGGLDLDLRTGVRATGLDLDRGRVDLDDGSDLAFDRLVIATGTEPRRLRTATPAAGVHYLRTCDDAAALHRDLTSGSGGPVVVIGAGFIGLEVASSARQLGLEATVLEALPVPLERAVGASMGAAVQAWHRSKGTAVRTGSGVAAILGSGRPEGVRLDDGTVVEAATVVIGVGVSPCTGWLEGSGVDLGDGVVCDSRLRVLSRGRPLPHVVAAGDVARWHHEGYGGSVRVEHWTNAADQGEVAARTLLDGDAAPPYTPVPYFWSDQYGMKLQFVGRTVAGDDLEILEGGFDDERFVAAYGRQGRLVAALGMRRPARVMALQRAIEAAGPFPPPPPAPAPVAPPAG